MPTKPTVFISYSHQDPKWMHAISALVGVLSAYVDVVRWEDRSLEPGREWEPQIFAAIDRAQAAVLLVSPGFLTSAYIRDVELPRLRARNTPIFVVYLAETKLTERAFLAAIQGVNDPAKPLTSVSREEVLDVGARLLQAITDALPVPERPRPVSNLPYSPLGTQFKGREGQSADVQERRTVSTTALEATLSNPHYESDLVALRHRWDMDLIVRPDTVYIVTGTLVDTELFDRPVAEVLRDAVDASATASARRRAIVISDVRWNDDKATISRHPLIAIGGPTSSCLSATLVSDNGAPERGAVSRVVVHEPPPIAAVWGVDAVGTRVAAEQFIRANDGLRLFLSLIP